jgi:anti-anti-sigma factor
MIETIPQKFTITNKDNVYRIKLAGDADIDFVNAFSKTAADLEQKKECTVLVVDMKDVSYIDSASVGIFVKLIKMYNKKNNSIIVYRPRAAITELFTLTGLSRFLTVCTKNDELEEEIRKKTKKKKPQDAE